MQVSGGCYCGKVRYEAEGEPVMRGLCHCRECQYITGGGANVALAMPLAGFRYVADAPKGFARQDLDNAVLREFCPECGTHLTSRPQMLPDLVIIKVGTLDDPSVYGQPDMALYCSERQPFHYLPEGLPQFDRFPE
ncbi:MAG: GFA family protein [Halioglobus sp.]|nr:GFA family protein [Halioglobus sp.]